MFISLKHARKFYPAFDMETFPYEDMKNKYFM